jgi:hypothetical protein
MVAAKVGGGDRLLHETSNQSSFGRQYPIGLGCTVQSNAALCIGDICPEHLLTTLFGYICLIFRATPTLKNLTHARNHLQSGVNSLL